jgi:hypothetical protein
LLGHRNRNLSLPHQLGQGNVLLGHRDLDVPRHGAILDDLRVEFCAVA